MLTTLSNADSFYSFTQSVSMGHTSEWAIHLYGPFGTHLSRHRQSGLHLAHSHNVNEPDY